MDLQFKSVPFEVKASASDGSTGEGLASCFYNVDTYNEIVDDTAFDADLPEFLDSGVFAGLNHNWDLPLGKPTMTKPSKSGLEVGWKISDTSYGRDMMVLLRDKVITKLSIGYQTLGRQILETLEDVQAYWKTKGYTPSSQDIARAQAGAILLTRIRLFEFSPVVVPANDKAFITAVKAAREAAEQAFKNETPEIVEQSERLTLIRAIATRKEAEEILCNAGFSKTERAAFISSVKTLLGNPAGDETTPPAEVKTEDGTGVDSPPEPVPDASVDTPETPDEPETPDAVEPTGETPEVTPPAEAETGKSADAGDHRYRSVDPKDPLGLDLLQLRRDTGTLLYQRFEDLSAQIDRVAIRR